MARDIVVDLKYYPELKYRAKQVIQEALYDTDIPEVIAGGGRQYSYLIVIMIGYGLAEEQEVFDALAWEFGDDVVHYLDDFDPL